MYGDKTELELSEASQGSVCRWTIQLMACRFCKTTYVSGKPSLCDLDKLEVPIALFLSPSGVQNRPQVKMEQEEEHLCILKTNKFLKQSC